MNRTKIDYGIDLGTTNSAIAVVGAGGAKVIKSVDPGAQNDITPSCVAISKGKKFAVGDAAYRAQKAARCDLANNPDDVVKDTYSEFKRMMGKDHEYESVHLGKGLKPEELSAEVLKHLKSYVLDEDVVAAVITHPAMFDQSQIDATQRAAELAGFAPGACVLLQEPIAASTAFGISGGDVDGRWIVFDFGGGTFDVALMEVDEGVMQVIDTAGDNLLGGRNIDEAIVDEILLPRFGGGLEDMDDDYSFDVILKDKGRRENLRQALKNDAEGIKIGLSKKGANSHEHDFEDSRFKDDEGKDVNGLLVVSLAEFEEAVGPIFQKAIDITWELLERNKLKDSDLERILLIGGPTLSQTCRRMLDEEFDTSIDTSIDPMTAVAVGAAVYASTCDLPKGLEKADLEKVQLKLEHASDSVETEEPVTIKVRHKKTKGDLPKELVVEFANKDGSWSSEKVPLGGQGELIDVILNEKKTNVFAVNLFDGKGNRIECEPGEFSILQGQKIARPVLGKGFGVGIVDRAKKKEVFAWLEGLEKGSSLPAIGKRQLRTQKELKPGNPEDQLRVPLYDGDRDAEGSPLGTCNLATEIIVENDSLPGLIPAGSEVEVTVNVDESRNLTGEVLFLGSDKTIELVFPKLRKGIPAKQDLGKELDKAKATLNMDESIPSEKSDEIMGRLYKIEEGLDNSGEDDPDGREQADASIKAAWKEIDLVQAEAIWPEVEERLRGGLDSLKELSHKYGNKESREQVEALEMRINEVIQSRDVKSGLALIGMISELHYLILKNEPGYWVQRILSLDENFDELVWKNDTKARMALNEAKKAIQTNPSPENLERLYWAIVQLMADPGSAGDDRISPDLLAD